jgi:hypothetical protein
MVAPTVGDSSPRVASASTCLSKFCTLSSARNIPGFSGVPTRRWHKVSRHSVSKLDDWRQFVLGHDDHSWIIPWIIREECLALQIWQYTC